MRAAALIALLAGGCSWTLIKAPPDEPKPAVYPECHDSQGAVVADVIFAILYGAAAIGAAADRNEYDDQTGEIVGSSGLAVVFAASAITGIRWTRRCGRLHDQWEREQPSEPVRIAPTRRPPAAPAEGALGAACFPNRTCDAGLACGPGQRCVAGDRGLEGMACFADGSCSGDLTCVSAMCTRPPAPECVSDAHCPEGLGLVCQDGYCTSPRSP